MPLVSVVIGTFNRADFLRSAILSVLSQTFQDFEIIVIDDASQDHTSKIIQALPEGKIKYIKHDVNKGIGVVRNTGLRQATGKYVAFLDDDDEWLPRKLQVQVDILEERSEKVGLAYCGFLTINRANGEIIGQYLPQKMGEMVNHVLVNNWIGTTSVPLIRKECFDRVGLFDERMTFGEDWDMFNRIAKEFHFEYIQEVLVKYYVHNGPQLTKNPQGIIASSNILLSKYGDIRPVRRTIGRYYVSIGAKYCYNYKNREGTDLIVRGIALAPYEIRHYVYLFLALAGSSNYRKFRAVKNTIGRLLMKIGIR